MKRKCSTQKNKLPYDHPIEKARYVLSAAYYNRDTYTKEDFIQSIERALVYISDWESSDNEQ